MPTVTTSSAATAAALRYGVLRLSRRLRKRAEYGLSPSRISLLTTLERHGELLVGDLTAQEQASKSSMTRMIAVLEKDGYVSRAVDPTDRRGFLVTLTGRGADVLRRAGARQDSYLARQLEVLSAEDRAVLEAAIPVIERLLEVRA